LKKKKTPRHLFNDYKISLEENTKTKQGLAYFHEV